MNRIVHFEIPADDTKRAIKFYQDVFGWTIKTWDNPQMEYHMAMTGPKEEPGIDGAIMPRMEMVRHMVNTIQVEDITTTLKKITTGGGKGLKGNSSGCTETTPLAVVNHSRPAASRQAAGWEPPEHSMVGSPSDLP